MLDGAFVAGWDWPHQTWAAAADDKAVADFYRGKTVRIIVGFSAGGGYDAYSRLIGRTSQKHIPGNPSIIVENMAGAGSIILANYMFNAAPKDGTVIGNFSGQIILEQLFGNPAVQYDLGKFRYLGVPIGETYLLIATRKSGVDKVRRTARRQGETDHRRRNSRLHGGTRADAAARSVGREHQSGQRLQRHRRCALGDGERRARRHS